MAYETKKKTGALSLEGLSAEYGVSPTKMREDIIENDTCYNALRHARWSLGKYFYPIHIEIIKEHFGPFIND